MNLKDDAKHFDFFKANLASWFENAAHCDVEFVVGSTKSSMKHLKANKVLFAIHSNYFKKLFYQSPNKDEEVKSESSDLELQSDAKDISIINENEVSVVAFEFIHKYFYGIYDNLIINESNVIDILFASNKYEIEPLITECTNYLKLNTSVKNVLSLLNGCISYNNIRSTNNEFITNIINTRLNPILIKSFETHSVELINSKEWLTLPISTIKTLFIQNDKLQVTEETIFEKCIDYCKYFIANNNNSNKVNIISDISVTTTTETTKTAINKSVVYETWQDMIKKEFIPHIRFPTMSKKYFTTNVVTSNLLSEQQIIDVALYQLNPTLYQTTEITEIEQTTTVRKMLFSTKPRIANNNLIIISDENESKYETFNYYNSGTYHIIPFTLTLSTEYSHDSDSRVINSFENCMNNSNLNQIIATTYSTNQWIQATFGKKDDSNSSVFVHSVEIGHSDGWGDDYLVGKKLQYFDNSNNKWLDILALPKFAKNELKTLVICKNTNAIRMIAENASAYVALGSMIFFSKSPKNCVCNNYAMLSNSHHLYHEIINDKWIVPYGITQSAFYYGRPTSYTSSISYNLDDIVATPSNGNSWLEFRFNNKTNIQCLEIGVPGRLASGSFGYSYLNSTCVEYLDNDGTSWKTLLTGNLNCFTYYSIKLFICNNVETQGIRLRRPNYHTSVGCVRVYPKLPFFSMSSVGDSEVEYTASCSSQYSGATNTYDALTNSNLVTPFSATNNGNSQWIQFTFDKSRNVYIDTMIIGNCDAWGVNYLDGRKLQYFDKTTSSWVDILTLGSGRWSYGEIKTFKINVNASDIRVFAQSGYVALGYCKFLTHNGKYKVKSDNNGCLGGGLITNYIGQNGMLAKYSIQMSSKYQYCSHCSYETLINDNLGQICGTTNSSNEWIQVTFDKLRNGKYPLIRRIDIGAPLASVGGWGISYINQRKCEYRENTDQAWKVWQKTINVNQEGGIREFGGLGMKMESFRISNTQSGQWLGIGCLRFYTIDFP